MGDGVAETETMTGDGGTARQSRSGKDTLLDARGLTKRFGDILANDRVDLVINKGEIHALLGENGAGKSTLVKMFYGSLEPDGGEILWQGQRVDIGNPAAARELGIGWCFSIFAVRSLDGCRKYRVGIAKSGANV